MPDQTREIAELIVAGGLGAGVTGFWAWLRRKASNPAELQTSEAAILGAATRLQEVMNEAAKSHVSDLRFELEAVRATALRLNDRVDHLEGENRQFRQRNESLEAVLRRQGIDIPTATAPGALLIVEGGHATVQRHEGSPT